MPTHMFKTYHGQYDSFPGKKLAKNIFKNAFFFKMLMIAWLHVNKKVMFKSNVLFLCLQVTEYVPRFSVIHSVLNYKCLHLDS